MSKEELGHARIHTGNGSIDDVVDTEDEAFDRAAASCPTCPPTWTSCRRGSAPRRRRAPGGGARLDRARDPRRVYKMRDLIGSVVDRDSFFEIGRNWGKAIITGLARLDGWPVALFAEDPYIYGGAWTADAARKVTRFIDLASTFHLPLVHLEDCPGFLIGKQSEEEGTIRHGSTALAALGQSTSPFCAVIIRKAFGVAGAANSKPGVTHFRYAWPSGDWGSLPIEGGLEVAYKAELAELDGAPTRPRSSASGSA